MNYRETAKLLPGESLTAGAAASDRTIIARGSGSLVWDIEGREYVDCVLGSGPMIAGHAHPVVIEAVQRQIALGSTFYALNERVLELAELVVDRAPCAESIQFCGSGGEATHYALRLARSATGRDAVIKFEGGFHGFNDYGVMSLFPNADQDLPNPEPSSAGVPAALRDEVFVARYNDITSVEEILDAHPNRVAAIIVEPVQRAISPLPGFLAGLRELADRHDVVLIFDEIVTGFRIARGGAQELFGVVPDLATYGKILGGGYGLAAITGKRSIMDTSGPGRTPAEGFVFINGTLNGNPVAAAAGRATLELLDDDAYRRLDEVGETVRSGIKRALAELGITVQVLGTGPMYQLRVTENDQLHDYRAVLAADGPVTRAILAGALADGVFVGAEKGYLSIVHSDDDVARIIDTFVRVAGAVVAQRPPVAV